MKKNERLLRVNQIVGQREVTEEVAAENRKRGKGPRSPKPAIQPIIPVSRASWWKGVKTGRYPAPIKLTERTTCWRESEVLALIEENNDVL